MLYHLLDHYQDILRGKLHFYAWEDVSFRCVIALLTSLVLCLLLGPKVIRWLIRMKVGDMPEFDHVALNELTRHKTNTPTMGGLIMLAGVLSGTLLWADLTNPFVQKGIFLLVWLGLLGGVDDWLKLTEKIKQRSRSGLHTWEKLIFQIGVSVLIATFLFTNDFAQIDDGKLLWLPFYKEGFALGFSGFVIMTVLVITATSNAVNLTDGMDGLATGCISIVSLVFILLCYVASEYRSIGLTWANYLFLPQIPGAGELAILCSAMFGACLGFLWFNCHPAQVFMGDVGSLPLGGLIGYTAVVTRHELLLFIIGGIFVIEALSVIVQVSYFKFSNGKRIFLCTPIHHHFHLKGWSEPQVVVRFWLICIAFAALAIATLKLR
jgi:phospho-N-acetylmuramoyl-pentapeptide-transferase